MDICRRIRQQSLGQLSHIIILTARESREDVIAGFAAGANDFITKPFHREELQARIKIGAQVVERAPWLHRKIAVTRGGYQRGRRVVRRHCDSYIISVMSVCHASALLLRVVDFDILELKT